MGGAVQRGPWKGSCGKCAVASGLWDVGCGKCGVGSAQWACAVGGGESNEEAKRVPAKLPVGEQYRGYVHYKQCYQQLY